MRVFASFVAVFVYLATSAPADASTYSPSVMRSADIGFAATEGSTNLNVRTFAINLNDENVTDTVIFDRSRETLTICRQNAIELCRSYNTSGAAEALPVQDPKSTRENVLLISKDRMLNVCTLSLKGDLDCRAVDDTFSQVLKVQEDGKAQYVRIRSNSENYMCSLLPGRVPTCNSAHLPAIASRGALVFGEFTTKTLQAVQIRFGTMQLCNFFNASWTCTNIEVKQGIVGPGSRVAAIYSAKAGLSQIFVADEKTLNVCEIIDATNPVLDCSSDVISSTSDLRMFVVTTRTSNGLAVGEQVVFNMPARIPGQHFDFSTLKSSINSNNAVSQRLTESKVLLAQRRVGQPNVSQVKKTPNSCYDTCGGGFSDMSLGAGFAPNDFQANYFDASNNFLGSDDTWSDSFTAQDPWQYLQASFVVDLATQQECYTDCDNTRRIGDDVCGIRRGLGVAASVDAAALAAVLFFETGPGALAIGFKVASYGLTLNEAIYQACEGGVSKTDQVCRQVCPQGHP